MKVTALKSHSKIMALHYIYKRISVNKIKQYEDVFTLH